MDKKSNSYQLAYDLTICRIVNGMWQAAGGHGYTKYRSLFPHVSAAIQSKKYSVKGDTIQYVYTDSKHSNPLCRVTPIESLAPVPTYDKEKIQRVGT